MTPTKKREKMDASNVVLPEGMTVISHANCDVYSYIAFNYNYLGQMCPVELIVKVYNDDQPLTVMPKISIKGYSHIADLFPIDEIQAKGLAFALDLMIGFLAAVKIKKSSHHEIDNNKKVE